MDIDWNIFGNSDLDVHCLSDYLVNVFKYSIEAFFPLKKKVISNKNPLNWFSDQLRKMRDTVETVKFIYNITKDPVDGNAYRVLRKDYRLAIDMSKKKACHSLILNADDKAKASWKLINFERNKMVRNNSKPNLSPKDYNEFFSSVADKIINDLPPSRDASKFVNYMPFISRSFFFEPVTQIDIVKAVASLKNSYCVDIYGLNAIIIKNTIDIFSEALACLFNLCFLSGTFPKAFKLSRVIPLYKKGDVNEADNYRPISIIPVFGKLLEVVVRSRISKFFEGNNILNPSQYGFRRNFSAVQAVSAVVKDVVEGFEEGKFTAVALCDLSKAFDCISHDLLLKKLEIYGFRGLPFSFIQSYLCERYQCVEVDGVLSDLIAIKHGVPQGSVLGPLLFVIYINDLYFNLLPERCYLYADDTSLLCTGTDKTDLLIQLDLFLAKAESWFTAHQLKLNKTKTQKIVFTSNNRVSVGNSVKLLGVTLDDTLTWSSHIDILSRRLSSVIFLLRKLKPMVDTKTLKDVYFSLFQSLVSYGLTLWGNAVGAIKIFILQKKAVRILAGVGCRDHCGPIFVSLQIMTFYSLFIYQTLTDIHKNINNFPLQSDNHHYETRSANLLQIPRYRLNKSVSNQPNIGLYNRLPTVIKQLNLDLFKKKLKSHLLAHSFYSIEKFHLSFNSY